MGQKHKPVEDNRELMLGNEAIARGFIESGCAMATSYPGTPASEILSSVIRFKDQAVQPLHAQWAVNEKVAFEIAYAGSMVGLRTAVSMKQVGLNVASDPLMSAAYMGTRGGFIVISADDPGPHSSQTEQDSRLMAMLAKIPVLDPSSPSQARDMVAVAFNISEDHEIPVMLRPTTRVCHARQDIRLHPPMASQADVNFEKNPARWAATPKFRFHLHQELEEKLKRLAAVEITAPVQLNPGVNGRQVVVVSGVVAAHAREVFLDMGIWENIPLYQVLQPFPLHTDFTDYLRESCESVLVIEETTGVIEMQVADHHRVHGKNSGAVPAVGELSPEIVERVICQYMGLPEPKAAPPAAPGRRPTLCAACPHRASFLPLRKRLPGVSTPAISAVIRWV